jgi:hypothetical protein
MMPGQAVENKFPAWLCELHAVLGGVAGQDLG